MKTRMLALSPWQFDQEPRGWRSHYMLGEYTEAVLAIQGYRDAHLLGDAWGPSTPQDPEGRVLPLHLLHWHHGQMLAHAGRSLEAIMHMEETIRLCPQERFRYYALGTIAFLQGDAEGIVLARTRGADNDHLLEEMLNGLPRNMPYRDLA